MKKIFIVICLLSVISCATKKKIRQQNYSRNNVTTTDLVSELISTTKILELMDVSFRKVETTDTTGNIMIETVIDLKKKTETIIKDTLKVEETIKLKEEMILSEQEEIKRNKPPLLTYTILILIAIFIFHKRIK